MKKRILAGMLAIVLLCSISVTAAPTEDFPFRSFGDLGSTRAQTATAMWMAAGEPEPESLESPFYDVSESDPFYKAVLWCREQELLNGITEDSFVPFMSITRAQAATTLHYFAAWWGLSEEVSGTQLPYVDVETNTFYYEAVVWCYENGMITGADSEYFYPHQKNECTHYSISLGSREPTCTEPGCSRGQICDLCGDIVSYEDEIPALGHTLEFQFRMEPGCETEGYDVYHCTVCQEVVLETLPAAGHSWDNGWVETMPTPDSEGVRIHDCLYCSATGWSQIPSDCPLASTHFIDLDKSRFYYEPVLWAVQFDITSGVDSTHFKPESSCTRAQVVTFLWRAMGCPAPQGEQNPFTDVSKDRFYYQAVLWATEAGITKGVDSTRFAPDQTVTRGQFVTFLWRLFGEPETTDVLGFADVSKGHFYYDAVLWAADCGITEGVYPTHFAPEGKCTRGQVVTFLYRT